ncbi:hypothetical protein [Fimbriimonas ginsengisoli]|uniref:hypothetical protein n=1 Tax=Fimbriimonas ginsengisoli TaxID=1005039 RepID=UPI00046D6AE3|nr:hypothetical protein [Fimbriimonas ginsengisoli]
MFALYAWIAGFPFVEVLPTPLEFLKAGQNYFFVRDVDVDIVSYGGVKKHSHTRQVSRVLIKDRKENAVRLFWWKDAYATEPDQTPWLQADKEHLTIPYMESTRGWWEGGNNSSGEDAVCDLDLTSAHTALVAAHGSLIERQYAHNFDGVNLQANTQVVSTKEENLFSPIAVTLAANRLYYSSTIFNPPSKSLDAYFPALFMGGGAPRSFGDKWGGDWTITFTSGDHRETALFHGRAIFSAVQLIDGVSCAKITVHRSDQLPGKKENSWDDQLYMRLTDGIFQRLEHINSGELEVDGIKGEGTMKIVVWRSDTIPKKDK